MVGKTTLIKYKYFCFLLNNGRFVFLFFTFFTLFLDFLNRYLVQYLEFKKHGIHETVATFEKKCPIISPKKPLKYLYSDGMNFTCLRIWLSRINHTHINYTHINHTHINYTHINHTHINLLIIHLIIVTFYFNTDNIWRSMWAPIGMFNIILSVSKLKVIITLFIGNQIIPFFIIFRYF